MLISKMINLVMQKKFFRFLIAGGINTAFSYCSFSVAMYLIGVKEIAVTINLVVCVLFNFMTSSRFVFKQKGISLKRVGKFYGIYLVTYVLNLVHLKISVDIWDWNVYIAQLATLLYIPWISFYLQKKIVFDNI